jgi:cationic peptide transport system ATP-binding protein
MPLLDIRNLTIEITTSQGRVKVVDKVNLTINEGEVRGLVGESGSGKSLIAKAIAGITKDSWYVSADRLKICDTDLLEMTARERRKFIAKNIAMIFQEPVTSLDPSITIGEQMKEIIPARIYEGKWWQRFFFWKKRYAEALLHRVGVKDHETVMNAYPQELSAGICQKVMIAMAIAAKPKLLIADEPISAIETMAQAQILRLLDKMHLVNSTTILLISNDINAIANLADTVSVMYCGQMVETGPRELILNNPHHPYTDALLNAIPDFSQNLPHKSPLTSLPGSIPPLQHLPIGCRLGPRCPYAQKMCVKVPPVTQIKGHQFYCHFPLNMEEPQK